MVKKKVELTVPWLVQKPPLLKTELQMLSEAHEIMEKVIDQLALQRHGHNFSQSVYDELEEWVNSHDFA